MDEHYLYIVFSSTPYKVGKFIRGITRATYNHTSISLDRDLTQMFAFARRHCHTPLYGGFVHESVDRYHLNGTASTIKLCQIPVSVEQYQAVESCIRKMEEDPKRYLYNHLSLLAAPFRKKVPVQDACVCVEFCVNMLHLAGFDIDPTQYYSIPQLESMLDSYTVYTGPIPETTDQDEAFFAKKPLPHPIHTSVHSIASLLPRIGRT